MAQELTPQVQQSIKDAAKAFCIGKGLTEQMPDPSVPGNTIRNPKFDMCHSSLYQKGLLQARSGNLNDWLNETRGFISEQGGLSGVFQKLGMISQNIRDGKPMGISESDFDDVTEKASPPPVSTPSANKSGAKVWIAVVVVIVLIVVLVVVMIKKQKVEQ